MPLLSMSAARALRYLIGFAVVLLGGGLLLVKVAGIAI